MNELRKIRDENYRKYHHYSTILSNKKKYLSSFTDEQIEFYKQKKNEYFNFIKQHEEEFYQLTIQLEDRKKKKGVKYQWTQACPDKDCKGFLNEDFDCPLCSKHYCKDCLENVSKEEVKNHVCNEELKETMKMIRKESRPCPTCGEYISKVSGCDQMFCTECGTAFSWITGMKEVGVIHNPHAHTYFQQNPEALQNYMNHRNGGNQGACREQVPNHHFKHQLVKNIYNQSWYDMEGLLFNQQAENMEHVRRHLAEFNAYRRNQYINQIHHNADHMDLRIKYLKNELDEKKFRTILHMRTKKIQFQKIVHEMILSTITIVTGLLWSMLDVCQLDDFLRIAEMIFDLRTSTNEMIQKLKEKHNYTEKIAIGEFFEIPRYL
jgi:hypothetical protein